MSGTVLVKCKCSHDYQDKVYGLGIRLANVGISKGLLISILVLYGKEHSNAVKKN